MTDSTSDRDPWELVAELFLARYRAGERPSVEEYATRHPELADQIRRLMPALVMMEPELPIVPDHAAALQPPAGTTGESRRLGDYRILREIGRGGMGVVYEAEQISLGRQVALKVLPRHVAVDRKALERFRREAKSAARLHHTNIVPVFEVGQDGETAYYAMQFIQGQGLDQVIDDLARLHPHGGNGAVVSPGSTKAARADGPGKSAPGPAARSLLTGRLATEAAVLSPGGRAAASDPAVTDRLDSGATLASAAALAHAATVTGRDEFVLAEAPASPTSAAQLGGAQIATTARSGRRPPYFRSVAQIGRQAAQGLAYAHARGIVHRDIKPSNLLLDHAGVVWIADFGLAKAGDDGLTESGDVLGTLRYMAPERFRGEGDARADIYALGLTLYELMTLRPAFGTSDRLKLIEKVKNEEPARPRSLDTRIPRDLETIILKAIEKDPKERYASAEALAEDLGRLPAGRANPRPSGDRRREILAVGQAEPRDRNARRSADGGAVSGDDLFGDRRPPDGGAGEGECGRGAERARRPPGRRGGAGAGRGPAHRGRPRARASRAEPLRRADRPGRGRPSPVRLGHGPHPAGPVPPRARRAGPPRLGVVLPRPVVQPGAADHRPARHCAVPLRRREPRRPPPGGRLLGPRGRQRPDAAASPGLPDQPA